MTRSRTRRVIGDRECPHCGGSGTVTRMEGSPGSLYGYREVEEECDCAESPEYDGPPEDEDRSTGNEEVEW